MKKGHGILPDGSHHAVSDHATATATTGLADGTFGGASYEWHCAAHRRCRRDVSAAVNAISSADHLAFVSNNPHSERARLSTAHEHRLESDAQVRRWSPEKDAHILAIAALSDQSPDYRATLSPQSRSLLGESPVEMKQKLARTQHALSQAQAVEVAALAMVALEDLSPRKGLSPEGRAVLDEDDALYQRQRAPVPFVPAELAHRAESEMAAAHNRQAGGSRVLLQSSSSLRWQPG